jgi:hypothetical protein
MKLTYEQKEELRQDILDRYDNEEYWSKNLLELFKEENKQYKIIFIGEHTEEIIVHKELFDKLYNDAHLGDIVVKD